MYHMMYVAPFPVVCLHNCRYDSENEKEERLSSPRSCMIYYLWLHNLLISAQTIYDRTNEGVNHTQQLRGKKVQLLHPWPQPQP